jgi:hypothetical protein
MWGAIIQFLTLFGGGVAIGTILEDDRQPVVIQQAPPAYPTSTPPVEPGTISPMLIIALAVLVLAAGYFLRVFRNN